MTFEFGPFKLDETGRALRRGAHDIQLQPRAFDLLVYLVRNRARMVPKDELLAAAALSSADPNLVHAFEDKTDQENLNFRYVY